MKKGFIQIPLLIGIITSVVITSAGAGVFLHTQGKLTPLTASISEGFRRTEKPITIEPEELSEEIQLEEPAIQETEEVSELQEELEEARLEIEREDEDNKIEEIENQEKSLSEDKEEQSKLEKIAEEMKRLTDLTERILYEKQLERIEKIEKERLEKIQEEDKEKKKIITELRKKDGLTYSIGDDGYFVRYEYYYKNNHFLINHRVSKIKNMSDLEILQEILNFILDKEKEWEIKLDQCLNRGGNWKWERSQCIYIPPAHPLQQPDSIFCPGCVQS